MKKPKRARFGRRAALRKADKLAADREKLAALEPGGRPERPIEVSSASLIEPRAAAQPCLRCDGACRVHDHEVDDRDGALLRVVTLVCTRCGTSRTLYFRVVGRLLN